MPDETARAGVGQHVIDFDGRQPCINWDGNDSQPTARIHQLDIVGSVGQEKSQAVSRHETSLSECSRPPFNTIVELHKSDSRAVAQSKCLLMRIVLDGATHGVDVNHNAISMCIQSRSASHS